MSIGMALGGCSNFAGSSLVAVALQKTDVRSRLIYLRLAISRISCAQLLLVR